MSHELTVFLVAGAVMALAYLVLYPRLRTKTLGRMMQLDLLLTVALLGVVGLRFYGTGTAFSVIFFDLPWWAFTVLSATAVEAPLFVWFCRKWGIDMMPPPD